jgi:hypothetical protein
VRMSSVRLGQSCAGMLESRLKNSLASTRNAADRDSRPKLTRHSDWLLPAGKGRSIELPAVNE